MRVEDILAALQSGGEIIENQEGDFALWLNESPVGNVTYSQMKRFISLKEVVAEGESPERVFRAPQLAEKERERLITAIEERYDGMSIAEQLHVLDVALTEAHELRKELKTRLSVVFDLGDRLCCAAEVMRPEERNAFERLSNRVLVFSRPLFG
jgi:hypothetical protein